jgi:hypothetical protein
VYVIAVAEMAIVIITAKVIIFFIMVLFKWLDELVIFLFSWAKVGEKTIRRKG